MIVKQIREENLALIWDQFVAENSSPSSFLQSFVWAKFRTDGLGEEVKMLAVFDDDTRMNTNTNTNGHELLLAVALFIKRKLPGGRFYLNCQRGPVFKTQNSRPTRFATRSGRAINKTQEITELLIDEIKKTAKKEKVVFIRMAPPYDKNDELGIMNYGWQRPKILVNLIEPVSTLVLDLTKSEAELLAAMHQKTRYNIKLAEKRNVAIRNQKPENRDIENFYRLLCETAKRDRINIFSKEYYTKLINYFINELRITNYELRATLLIAEFEGKMLAAILVIGFGDTATYLYGASGNEGRELMPNYLLQWSAIKWAKEQGYKKYDFWGVTQMNSRMSANKFANDGWAGITRFKRGFVNEKTGKEINYLGVYDLVLSQFWYNLYRMGKMLKI
jgi:lipid II:glycine glycyltransferase (peptidoglycan interpeptide bridge formation enzyme)